MLRTGDRFRVHGGPVYVTDSGKQIPFHQRGIFVFHRDCQRGAGKWIEAYREDGGGVVILWVGKTVRHPDIPNLRRRPYRIAGKLRSPNTPHHRKGKSSSAGEKHDRI